MVLDQVGIILLDIAKRAEGNDSNGNVCGFFLIDLFNIKERVS